ncbi:hypothetical protein GF337_01085 [candidate division KSB1 bacterium]|nr:hypothetical protein [candidate division KSB1 bacterium]
MSIRKITKIEVQKKRKNRCNIYLDEEFAFGLDQDILLKFDLYKGRELSDADIENILDFEEKKNAKDRALKFLSHRDRSEKEIVDKLKQIGFNREVIDWTLSELKRMQFIDDNKFAISFANTKMVSKPIGEYLLRRELAAKGIEEEVIEQTVERVYCENDQETIALELAQSRMKRYKNLDAPKAKKRISDFLLRRGFNWDITSSVLERLEID